jgi:hypothetical protein
MIMTIEGPRETRLRLSQGESLKPDENEGCSAPLSPVVGQSDFARFGSLTEMLLPHFDLPCADTGAEDRVGAPAEFAVVAGTVGCREDVGALVLR